MLVPWGSEKGPWRRVRGLVGKASFTSWANSGKLLPLSLRLLLCEMRGDGWGPGPREQGCHGG